MSAAKEYSESRKTAGLYSSDVRQALYELMCRCNGGPGCTLSTMLDDIPVIKTLPQRSVEGVRLVGIGNLNQQRQRVEIEAQHQAHKEGKFAPAEMDRACEDYLDAITGRLGAGKRLIALSRQLG